MGLKKEWQKTKPHKCNIYSMLHYSRLIQFLLIGLFLYFNHPKGKATPLRTQPRYIKPNIERMKQNPSIDRYVKDSINRVPFNQPTIYIQLEPLNPRLLGITYRLENNIYLIGLNPLYSHPTLERTLHHELVHVKQLDRGHLHEGKWMGQPQDWSLPWSSRPWEQQAERETHLLYRP